MTSRAALLIDWDNVKASFIESGYASQVTDRPEPLLQKLIEKAEKEAKSFSPAHSLGYKGIAAGQ